MLALHLAGTSGLGIPRSPAISRSRTPCGDHEQDHDHEQHEQEQEGEEEQEERAEGKSRNNELRAQGIGGKRST